ncbi:hypothetical protein K8I61_03110 [bacterium]|nr:hypothetical protein [bacterium]
MTNKEHPGTAPAGDPAPFSWVSWPVVERKATILVVAPVCAAALAAVVAFTGDIAWAAIGAVLLAIGLREYFLPMRYEIDAAGVRARGILWTQSRPWNRVRRVVKTQGGVLLSPFAEPSRIERHRGLFLRCGDRRDEVAGRIEELRRAAGER